MLWRSWPPYSTSCWSRRSTWPSSTPSGQRWRQAWIPRRLPRLMNHVLSKIILIILPACISWYQPFSFPCDQEQERTPCQDIPGIVLMIQLDYNIFLCSRLSWRVWRLSGRTTREPTHSSQGLWILTVLLLVVTMMMLKPDMWCHYILYMHDDEVWTIDELLVSLSWAEH